ncbi:unnamed protein product, partial [Protopolystoma xenopodis]
GYIPTNEDIVWSRRPTDSIIEEEIALHGTRLVFIDVGGQTKERRKWCQCFTGMTSVLFLVACSHFDEHYRDRLTREFRNKLHESMIIFNGLINHVAFRRVSVIIFFNKTDILKEKVASRTSNIRDTFPNFPQSYDPFKLHDVQVTFYIHSILMYIRPLRGVLTIYSHKVFLRQYACILLALFRLNVEPQTFVGWHTRD